MSDANLLLFGCAVSFIALGGAYVYLRTSFERRAREPERFDESRLEPHAPLGRPE